jgi:hypothetical protein
MPAVFISTSLPEHFEHAARNGETARDVYAGNQYRA